MVIRHYDTKPTFRYAIISDTHIRPYEESSSPWKTNLLTNDRARWVAHAINAHKPDFVIHLGDIVHPVPHLPTYEAASKVAREIMEGLESPCYFVPGNHDVVTPEAEKVYAEVWGEDKFYYSFDHGPVHSIVLDCWWGEEDDRISQWQLDWLIKDLEEYAARNGGKNSEELGKKAIFAYLHSPLWRYAPDTPGRKDWNRVH